MNTIHKMPPRTPSGEKTTYEQIFERGMGVGQEEGFKQGREIAIRIYILNNPTVSDQDIADSFEISLDYARQIRDYVDQFLVKKNMTLFSRIIQGEIPCYKVAETADHFAFLDIRPQTIGHTLCIPKVEVDYIFDLDDQALSNLMIFSKRVAAALKSEIPCKRIGLAVVGLEVPHTHIHLFPLQTMADFGFGKEALTMSSAELQSLADRIAARFESTPE